MVDLRFLKFKKNLYGKFEVDWVVDDDINYLKLKFNILYMDLLIVCGVIVNVLVGIDVEDKIRKLRYNVLLFVKRFYLF